MRSFQRLRTPEWMDTRSVLALGGVVLVVLIVALASVVLIKPDGHQLPAEPPAPRAAVTPVADSQHGREPTGASDSSFRIPPPTRTDDMVSLEGEAEASKAPLDQAGRDPLPDGRVPAEDFSSRTDETTTGAVPVAPVDDNDDDDDGMSERSDARAVASSRDLDTEAEGSSELTPRNGEPANLNRSPTADAPHSRRDDGSVSSDTQAAQQSAEDADASPSASPADAEPEQPAASSDSQSDGQSGGQSEGQSEAMVAKVDSTPSGDGQADEHPRPANRAPTRSTGLLRDQYTSAGEQPQPASDPRMAALARSLADNPGPIHTWRDGDAVRRVQLVEQLVVQRSADNTNDDLVIIELGAKSIVLRQGRHASAAEPVFRSVPGGDLMTLPGGVLMAFDADWDAERIAGFFAERGIASSRVSERHFRDHAFFIQTAPGLASLKLANALVELEGVHLAVPNWQTEAITR